MVDMAIANTMYDLDDPSSFEPAIRIANEAVQMMSLTDDRFHDAWVRRQAGHMYLSKGDAESANRLYDESYKILLSTLDTGHHETLLTSGYLGISEQLINPNEHVGEDRYRQAIRLLSEQLGPEHNAVVTLIDAHTRALRHAAP
jgi:tetratricopeptide (TPR) repeat protein